MKRNRILAVLLAVVILAGSFVVISTAAPSMDSSLVKTTYYDWEYFNPQGLVVMDGVTPVTYSADNEDFVFIPSLDELLTVETAAVRVIYKNQEIGSIVISVDHSYGKVEYLGAKDHGRRCKGCGKIDQAVPHQAEYVYDNDGNVVLNEYGEPKENWIPNDDGGMFVPQTECATCSVCGGQMKRNIEGTERFLFTFDFDNMTDLELEIIVYMQSILVTLIQALVSF